MRHPIDHLEEQRREIVAVLRKRMIACGLSRRRLAVLSGLADRALKNFEDDGWNPKAETIRKIDAFLIRRAAGGTVVPGGPNDVKRAAADLGSQGPGASDAA
jgi:transcriptional regulator with XRE-family HTH domain